MAIGQPARATTDHTGSPPPKPAKGVKIAASLALGALALLSVVGWLIYSAVR